MHPRAITITISVLVILGAITLALFSSRIAFWAVVGNETDVIRRPFEHDGQPHTYVISGLRNGPYELWLKRKEKTAALYVSREDGLSAQVDDLRKLEVRAEISEASTGQPVTLQSSTAFSHSSDGTVGHLLGKFTARDDRSYTITIWQDGGYSRAIVTNTRATIVIRPPVAVLANRYAPALIVRAALLVLAVVGGAAGSIYLIHRLRPEGRRVKI